jgi:hypothetical protein
LKVEEDLSGHAEHVSELEGHRGINRPLIRDHSYDDRVIDPKNDR